MYESSKSILPNLSTQEFDEFVQKYQRNLDNIEPDMQENSMHYGGIPYDPGIYANSKFRLISESNMNLTPPLISEKTYLTIVNKNPFVIAGDLNSCQYLRNLGFETFDQLFDIPTYDNIQCVDARLSCVIAHVKQWLAGNFDRTQVAEMVEHNYNRYIELGSKIKQDFENATRVDIDLAIYSRDTNHLAMSKGW